MNAGADANMKINSAIAHLVAGEHLDEQQSYSVFHMVMGGEATEGQIGALLALMQARGASHTEVTGAARVMRELSLKVKVNAGDEVDVSHLVDTCGTGGSGPNKLFNVSTAAAFVAAAAGARVAKHGNRRASGNSGSADVLELAGAAIGLQAAEVGECIERLGVGFMFAPAHHSAMRHVMPVRRALGVPTIFNMLGPLTNPAGAPNQVIGVGQSAWLPVMAEALGKLGSQHVLLVHSHGLDEIALDRETEAIQVRGGRASSQTLTPEAFGVQRRSVESLSALSAKDVETSLALLRTSLTDPGSAASDLVRINAAAALYVAGLGADLMQASAMAGEALSSGAAFDRFEAFIDLTNKLDSARSA